MTTDAPTHLRTAAAKLRASAGAATGGKWMVYSDGGNQQVGSLFPGGSTYAATNPADAAHIALTANPAFALAVAAWLDATADRVIAGRPHSKGGRSNHGWRGSKHALALADLINT